MPKIPLNNQSAFLLGIFVGLTAMGTACQAPQQRPPAARPPPPVYRQKLPGIGYTIQAGAFSTQERARRYAQRLQKDGLDAFHFLDADGLYKVRLQNFTTRKEAHDQATALQTRGLIQEFFIVRPNAGTAKKTLRKRIVDTARRFIGTPYQWGGESAKDGFDCSGFAMTVYRLNGLELPRSTRAQFRTGRPVRKDELEVGDLVFFATGWRDQVSHVGIYYGQNKFIHASQKSGRIRKASLGNSYFRTRYKGARSYLN